eukprot:TRINITY_DN3331_c0_g1_i1.p1 TRINITY_DN3331_c0_g1~~TRINITY_DN3331_c0_g1_i1.p1  ORF type:complete len:538 (+),score=120.95 TRINITY_DN3331_c0_g1_i1:58-1671(+)
MLFPAHLFNQIRFFRVDFKQLMNGMSATCDLLVSEIAKHNFNGIHLIVTLSPRAKKGYIKELSTQLSNFLQTCSHNRILCILSFQPFHFPSIMGGIDYLSCYYNFRAKYSQRSFLLKPFNAKNNDFEQKIHKFWNTNEHSSYTERIFDLLGDIAMYPSLLGIVSLSKIFTSSYLSPKLFSNRSSIVEHAIDRTHRFMYTFAKRLDSTYPNLRMGVLPLYNGGLSSTMFFDSCMDFSRFEQTNNIFVVAPFDVKIGHLPDFQRELRSLYQKANSNSLPFLIEAGYPPILEGKARNWDFFGVLLHLSNVLSCSCSLPLLPLINGDKKLQNLVTSKVLKHLQPNILPTFSISLNLKGVGFPLAIHSFSKELPTKNIFVIPLDLKVMDNDTLFPKRASGRFGLGFCVFFYVSFESNPDFNLILKLYHKMLCNVLNPEVVASIQGSGLFVSSNNDKALIMLSTKARYSLLNLFDSTDLLLREFDLIEEGYFGHCTSTSFMKPIEIPLFDFPIPESTFRKTINSICSIILFILLFIFFIFVKK